MLLCFVHKNPILVKNRRIRQKTLEADVFHTILMRELSERVHENRSPPPTKKEIGVLVPAAWKRKNRRNFTERLDFICRVCYEWKEA